MNSSVIIVLGPRHHHDTGIARSERSGVELPRLWCTDQRAPGMLAHSDPIQRSVLPTCQHADGPAHLLAIHPLTARSAELGCPPAGQPEYSVHRLIPHLRAVSLRFQQAARLLQRPSQFDCVAVRRPDSPPANQLETRVSGIIPLVLRGWWQSCYRKPGSVRPAYLRTARAQPYRQRAAGPQPQLGRWTPVPDQPTHCQRHMAACQFQRIPSQSPRVSNLSVTADVIYCAFNQLWETSRLG